jgi:hypothetical protein
MDFTPSGFKYVSVKQEVAVCDSASFAIIIGLISNDKK